MHAYFCKKMDSLNIWCYIKYALYTCFSAALLSTLLLIIVINNINVHTAIESINEGPEPMVRNASSLMLADQLISDNGTSATHPSQEDLIPHIIHQAWDDIQVPLQVVFDAKTLFPFL